ncbi:MAG: hypothetical protein CUN53_07330, partial [Phototrophicales bacterium]
MGITVSNLIIYLFPYLVSAAVAAGLGVYLLRKQRRDSALTWLALYMFSQTAWTLLYIGELVAPDISTKVVWDSVQWIPTFTAAYTWLRLVFAYTNAQIKPPWLLHALFIPLVIFLILVFTDPLHRLVYIEVYLESAPPFDALTYPFTPLIWTFVIYAYLLYLSGAAMMLMKARSDTGYQRIRTLIIVIGSALPALFTLFLFIFDARIFGQRDVTPIASIIGSFIILWGLLRYRLFDVIPLARALVFDSLSQGLVVVDVENRIMDANPAALAIVGKTLPQILGQPFSKVYSDWSQVIDEFDQAHEVSTDVQSTDADGSIRHYELRVMAIRKSSGGVIGRLITYHDITDRKYAELALRAAEQCARLLA